MQHDTDDTMRLVQVANDYAEAIRAISDVLHSDTLTDAERNKLELQADVMTVQYAIIMMLIAGIL